MTLESLFEAKEGTSDGRKEKKDGNTYTDCLSNQLNADGSIFGKFLFCLLYRYLAVVWKFSPD